MGMIEHAAKLRPAPKGAQPRSRASRFSFHLFENRANLLEVQPARTGSGQPVLVKFTPEAAQMWQRLKAAGKTPKVTSYGANYAPPRTRANPTGKTEITVTSVAAA
jgi:hypothetical protein